MMRTISVVVNGKKYVEGGVEKFGAAVNAMISR